MGEVMRQLPVSYRGRLIVGAIRVADDPSELPDKWVVMTQDYGDEKLFDTHVIGCNKQGEWVGINGHYGLSWERAGDDMCERASEYGQPVGLVPGRG